MDTDHLSVTDKDYSNGNEPTWCPGCGDFAVLKAIQRALAQLAVPPERTVLVSGIGCSGKISHYFGGYAIHTTHGRALPVAQGIALTRPDLTVLVASGDGDGYGIGLSHLLHAARRNINLLYVVMDNGVYGNTKGQTSPTSPVGYRSNTTPQGVFEDPVHPLLLAWAAGASWVGQGFSGDVQQLTTLVMSGLRHPGFGLLNVFSPCVVFNRRQGYDFFRERVTPVTHACATREQFVSLLAREAWPTGILWDTIRDPFPSVAQSGSEAIAQDVLRAILN